MTSKDRATGTEIDRGFAGMAGYRREFLASAALAVLTAAVFWQVRGHDFINYDDREYVTLNAQVKSGLNGDSLRWAWATNYFGNWHPLTWMSLELDGQLYGLNPAGFHITNLILHLASILLLFWTLRSMTGAFWRSALVAALFAVHPLNVEPVAWVAERKGVLSTFFWMLTLWAYLVYTREPGIGRYLVVVLALALGLMAKPMLLTMPFTLLLLDFWPLCRLRTQQSKDSRESVQVGQAAAYHSPVSIGRLIWEKLPLVILVLAFGVIAARAQGGEGAVKSLEMLPLQDRFANAAFSYARYMGKAIWPSGLVPFYPHIGNSIPPWQIASALGLIVAASIAALRGAGQHAYLAVGWFWYLGTLVPVIGLVQIGVQGSADRYAYVPLIGLLIAAVWGVAELAQRFHLEVVAGAFATVVLLIFGVLSSIQVSYWHDNITLWTHTIKHVNTPLAQVCLGLELEEKRPQEAVSHYLEAVRLDPNGHMAGARLARLNLGLLLQKEGKLADAISYYHAILRRHPDDVLAHTNLGVALEKQGKLSEAAQEFAEALRIQPDFALAHRNLGEVLAQQGELAESAEHFERALHLNPEDPLVHTDLGANLERQGKITEAIEHFREALRLNPRDPVAYVNLAVDLERKGQIQDAIRHYQDSLAIDPRNIAALGNLARALEKQGRFAEAESCLRQLVTLEPKVELHRLRLASFLKKHGQSAATGRSPMNP